MEYGKTYLDRVSEFPLLSIRSQSELQAAQQVIDRLLMQPKLARGDEVYLDALSDLVAAYEDAHVRFPAASEADMLRHLMEAQDITQVQLHEQTGIAKSTISEILSGKRPFSRHLIRTLSEFFDVDKPILAANL